MSILWYTMVKPQVKSWPIIGHDRVVDFLQSSLRGNRVSHAYLLSGPARVGKTTVAEHFAATLLCEQGRAFGYPCGECRACHQREVGVHPDYHVLSATSSGATAHSRPLISLEQVKQLQQRLQQKPVLSSGMVAIVNGAEFLSEPAANALLKTVEEPSLAATILITTDVCDRVPVTLRSRCQRLRFSLVATAHIDAALRNLGVSHHEAEQVASLVGGRPGWALEFMHHPDGRTRYESEVAAFAAATRMTMSERLVGLGRWWRNLPGDPPQDTAEVLRQRLAIWVHAARDAMLHSVGCGYLSAHNKSDGISFGSPREWTAFVHELCQTEIQLRQNVNPRLAFELLLMALPSPPGPRSS